MKLISKSYVSRYFICLRRHVYLRLQWLTYDTILNNPFLKLLVEFLPSLTVTVLNFLVPLIFQKLVLAEGYSPTTEIKITIFR